MIRENNDLDSLRRLREKRYGYKSKALITKEILLKEFSKEEAIKLRKYTNDVNDMDHYYAGFIANTEDEMRKEYKIRRDNFKKKYKHKRWIYPDFRENLKTTMKWISKISNENRELFFESVYELFNQIGKTEFNLIITNGDFIKTLGKLTLSLKDLPSDHRKIVIDKVTELLKIASKNYIEMKNEK